MKRTFLRISRQNSGLTLKKASTELGIGHRYLSEIELGKKNPSLEVSYRLEKLFGVQISKLLKRDGDED